MRVTRTPTPPHFLWTAGRLYPPGAGPLPTTPALPPGGGRRTFSPPSARSSGFVVDRFWGVFGRTWAAARGVGFTVSLLIGDLAYPGTEHSERVTTAVIVAFRLRVRQLGPLEEE